MFITDDFVMLNYPKTGSSFVRAVLKNILDHRRDSRPLIKRLTRQMIRKQDFIELILPNIKVPGAPRPPDQHGCYCQIPVNHINKKIVSVSRNPVSRLVSSYEFQDWVRWPLLPQEVLTKKYPGFPHLNMEEFTRYQNDAMIYGRLEGKPPRAHVGTQTIQFIQMFFKHPERIIGELTDAYLDSDAFIKDMGPIHFLRQEHLLDDLIRLLKAHSFSDEDIEIARRCPPVNVTQGRKVGIEEEISEAILQEIGDKERLLYRIYRHLGIEYQLELIR